MPAYDRRRRAGRSPCQDWNSMRQPLCSMLATLPSRWMAPKFPLHSRDFIKRGIEKGPRLGAALAAAEEAWIAAGFPTDKAALAAFADAAIAATAGGPS